jgi:hypothetical protein
MLIGYVFLIYKKMRIELTDGNLMSSNLKQSPYTACLCMIQLWYLSVIALMLPFLIACGGGGGEDLVGSKAKDASPSSYKFPHTGIISNQCYRAGSDKLVACNSPEAIALSGTNKQDGMLFRAMEYANVANFSKEECIKDNNTGLIWEGKTKSGIRAVANTYTNFDDGRSGDASAYVAVVNAQALCSYTDWRMPTRVEMQNLVNYGGLLNPSSKLNYGGTQDPESKLFNEKNKPEKEWPYTSLPLCPEPESADPEFRFPYCELPSPRIDPVFFVNTSSTLYWECANTIPTTNCQKKTLPPNTEPNWYWTSTGLANIYGDAWSVTLNLRSERYPVRLVRSDP